jgi:uncharacterized lipoprotein YmbA
MRRRPLLLLPALLAACASPPADLYTLAAIPGTPVPTARRSIELRRIGLAGYLDRPEIVRAAVNYRLQVNDRDRWGEPLGRMLGRVLTEDLVQRLPDAAVFAESGAISTQPDTILEIDVQRFDADAAGSVVLLAQIAIRHDGTRVPATARTLRLTAPVSGPATADLVATLSGLLAQLADTVARTLADEKPPAR